jgi:hypothetical protein
MNTTMPSPFLSVIFNHLLIFKITHIQSLKFVKNKLKFDAKLENPNKRIAEPIEEVKARNSIEFDPHNYKDAGEYVKRFDQYMKIKEVLDESKQLNA